MGVCQYHEIEIQNSTPIFNNAKNNCYYVWEGSFIMHNGPSSRSDGLVTTGAVPCLVVVVHDQITNRGCMAHITENLNNNKTFLLADEVIEHMIIHLIGFEDADHIQIFLFQGQGRFRGYPAYLGAHQHFGRCIIENHIDNGFRNYIYFPKRCEIFPVTRPIADFMANYGPSTSLPYELDARKTTYEFKTDFHSRWGDFLDTPYV